MLVSNRMTEDPITITPDDFLINAKEKMEGGKFHRLPVVTDGRLVGIITDRDLRAHVGYLAQTKVNGAMTEKVLTVSPSATLEEAAHLLLKHQIGGLPVIDNGHLVGVITASDVIKAFLDVMGASEPASARIDFILEGEEHGLTEASRILSREGGVISGVGTYREKFGENPVCYLRVLRGKTEHLAQALRAAGFNLLGMHDTGG